MAETKTVKLEVQSNVDQVTAEFEKTGKAINTATDDVKNFNKSATAGTDDIVKSQKKAQDTLKKTANETKKAGQNFKEFKNASDGVKKGFETAEGALALFGAETEVVEEQMKNLGQVMNLAQNIKGLKEGVGAWKTFGKTAITALQGMGKAVIATGIGALVVGVALLVAYWEDIVSLMGGAEAEGEKILEQSIEQAELQKEKYNASVKYEDLLRAQGKSEKFIRDLQMEELNLAIEKAKVAVENAKQQKALAIESAKFNQMVLEGVLKVILFPLDMIVRTYNKIAQYVPGLSPMGLLSSSIAKAVFDVEDAAAEADEKIKQAETTLKDLELQKAKIVLKEKAEASSRYKDQQKMAKDHAKKMEKIETERLQNLTDQYNEYLDKIEEADEREYQRKLTDQQRDEAGVNEYYFNLIGQAESYRDQLDESDENYLEKKKQFDDQILNLEKQQKEELAIINDEYLNQKIADEISKQKEIDDLRFSLMNEGLEKELKALDDDFKAKYELAKGNKELELALDKEYADKRNGIEKDFQRAKVQMALRGFEAIGDIISAFNTNNEEDAKKQFQIQKAFNLASAVTNTALAVTGALTAGGNPIKLATGAQFVEAGIAAAVGAANIIKIASSQFGKGDTGNGGTDELAGAGDTVISPDFNIVGDSGINDLEGLGQPAPIQAFVTSQDVTTAQGLDRARVQNATI